MCLECERLTREFAEMTKQRDALKAACDDFVWLDRREAETAGGCFERVAARFQRETGMLAPGKDQAAACCGSPTHDERRIAYVEWFDGFYGKVKAALALCDKEQPE